MSRHFWMMKRGLIGGFIARRKRMRDWLITTGAGLLGGALGVGAALVLMQVAGALDPFSPLAYLFLLALPLLGGLGVVVGSRLAEKFIEERYYR